MIFFNPQYLLTYNGTTDTLYNQLLAAQFNYKTQSGEEDVLKNRLQRVLTDFNDDSSLALDEDLCAFACKVTGFDLVNTPLTPPNQ